MKKEKIAILGGGLGAMTAAFYLTSTEELRNKYQVTIYQMGWRLGGKGASGRDIRRGDRIEEHGLHMFMGFYENAFRLMRDAYGEWIKQPQNPFRSWTDAFKPVNLVTLQQEVHGRSGKHWVTRKLEFPELPGLPGDGINLPPLLLLIRDLLGFLKSVFSHLESGWENSLSWEEEIDKALESIGDDLKDAFSVGEKQAARLKDPNDERNAPEGNRSTHPILDAIHGFIDRCFEKDESPDLGADLIRGMQSRLADLQPEEGDGFEDLIFYWNLLDMGLALGLGLLVDVLPYGADGYNRINNQDFRRWLMKHGASEASAWSAGVRALYDLAFAFKGGTGKPDDASMPAGAAAKTMLNLGLAYKGAPLWTMEAGMGDAVFTPMYEILARQRGVEFKFFHKLTGLALDDSGQSVARLDFGVQADITADQYEPLYEVKGFPCWPSEPAWGQIKNGVELQKAGANFESYWQDHCVRKITLQQGSDFDKVVMGLSIGAFPIVCEALNQNDSWKKMVETTETVQTRAVQLWMKPDPKAMGWEGGTTAMTSYAEPMDSWGQLAHLMSAENWPQGRPETPHGVQYFCNVLPDDGNAVAPIKKPDYPNAKKAQVKSDAIQWLDQYIGHIWPKATNPQNPDGLDYSLLVDFENRKGKERFNFQYWRANVDPTERYVLSVPESMHYRKHPGESGFANLFLAGDWTISRINGGAAEAAVQSGMLCAQAICGVPANIFDPPPPGPAAPPPISGAK